MLATFPIYLRLIKSDYGVPINTLSFLKLQTNTKHLKRQTS